MAIFDTDAPIYDTWFEVILGQYADCVETKIIFDLLKPKKGMHILDVGCGTGNFSIKLAKLGCHVTGVDVSGAMLEKARENAKKEGVDVTFIEEDISTMAFEDVFDGVCSNTALEFFGDKEKAIATMLRSVKKEGLVVVGTINKESSWYDFYAKELEKENSFFAIFKYASFISEKEMKAICTDNLIQIKKGLFIPPDIEEAIIDLNDLEQTVAGEKGGFICGQWKK